MGGDGRMSSSRTNDQIWSQTCYFDDGLRKIDFVLVTTLTKTPDEMRKLNTFVSNLQLKGIQTELTNGITKSDLIFIKLHAPDDVLWEIAKYHKIILECENDGRTDMSGAFELEIFKNIATCPDPWDPVSERAPQSLSGEFAKVMTSAERTLAMNKLLLRATFSPNPQDRGVKKLIKHGVIINAYPIHDSKLEWTDTGPLSDRQLLREYWGTMRCWYKIQPLNLIRKYYGPEVAFYFAFLGFYNKMLVPAAIIGLFCFIYSFITLDPNNPRIVGYCESEQLICPKCFDRQFCKFEPMKFSCFMAKLTCLFDNSVNIVFAIFMSFWSTIFREMWKRREIELRFKWNLMAVEADTAIRLDYYDNTKYRRLSRFTGQEEAYVPTMIKCLNYSITVLCCLVMVCIVLLAVFLVLMYRLTMVRVIKAYELQSSIGNVTLFLMSTSCLISLIFIKVFAPWYTKLAIMLTIRENPRTYVEFHNSCIYKSYILAFTNNYFPIFYLALIKGKLYTYPGDENMYGIIGLRTDLCHTPGCVVGLTTMLLFILVLKTSVAQLFVIFIPLCKMMFKKKAKSVIYLPSWERDFQLEDNGRFVMLKDYMELAIQYGFVTFFVSALPIAPLLALINNIVELRMDAYKRLSRFKRPIANRLPGIGAWNIIFQMATYLGTVTNALVIAFTSGTISRELYKYNFGDLKNYINSTMSEFKLSDFSQSEKFRENFKASDVCLYQGYRQPYYMEDKYKYSEDYWKILSIQLGFVVIFEQVIWILTAVCASSITNEPEVVKQGLREDQLKIKEIREQALNESVWQKRLCCKFKLT